VHDPVRSANPTSTVDSSRRRLVTVTLHRPVPAIEPPASRWIFTSAPPVEEPQDEPREQGRPGEVVGVGADLEPGTLINAYRSGVFPMPLEPGLMAWWSPDPRGILPLDGLRVSRSLRRSCSRYTIRIDTAFEEVIAECGHRRRRGAWIDEDVKAAYIRLHRWGWAHSVEAWDPYGRLAGGLYGVAIGGLFAGESMFHRQTDASKVALVGLVDLLREAGAALLDVQWATAHLRSLGVVEVRRSEYLERLAGALLLPQPAMFGG
jgi:leucyl/phenylalanyl-tRNA--protein transferase